MQFTVERLPDDHEEMVELIVADDAARHAVSLIGKLESLRFLIRDRPLTTTDPSTRDRPFGVQIALATNESFQAVFDLLDSRPLPTLRLCVVAGPVTLEERRRLNSRFDAISWEHVAWGDAGVALASGLRALLANVTADQVAVPPEQLYPVYANAGELSRVELTAGSVSDLARRASAAVKAMAAGTRIAAHLTISAPSGLADACGIASSIMRDTRLSVFEFVWSVSVSTAGEHRISLIGAPPPSN